MRTGWEKVISDDEGGQPKNDLWWQMEEAEMEKADKIAQAKLQKIAQKSQKTLTNRMKKIKINTAVKKVAHAVRPLRPPFSISGGRRGPDPP